jgi:TonB-dependent SusC/RagA subfamily outer membrane receptor
MKIRIILLILLSVFCAGNLIAQKVTITGTVLGADKQPVANAIVMVDDQKTNSITDSKGTYKVKVKATAAKISIFTFGMGTSEEMINGRTQIDFNFSKAVNKQAEAAPEEQGVSNGYGLVKKKDLTTTVNSIDGTKSKYASYHTIQEMIEREVSGIRMNGNSVIIQGSKDMFGDVAAIIVVDGVTMDELPDLRPSDVKSIDVLKGSAAAIYGSRAFGGAIVIKTKLQAN